MRTKQLDLIYAQSGLLYEIIPNAQCSNLYPKFKPRPHANGIVGFASTKLADSVTIKVSQLSINQYALGQATTSSIPTQSVDALSMQSSNPKGNQKPGRNKKKGKNNRKGGNKNDNETNDKTNNNNNVRGTRILRGR